MDNQFSRKPARQLLQLLESLQAAGVQQIGRRGLSSELVSGILPASPTEARAAPDKTNRAERPAAGGEEVPAAARQGRLLEEDLSGLQPAATAPSLEVLAADVAACQLCEELATTRTQTVFGVGNPQARLCFLGEAPGADEDRLGEPFVGRAGQLLDKILAACQLSRSDVYILNVLRCRPPGNRTPMPGEASNCRPFLHRQLQLVQPEFVCCLGAVAAQNFLDTTASIGRLRGKVHLHHGVQVVCTYHPAYLLRNPSAKRSTWEDMQLLMAAMGTPVGG